jgi:hypothetical protein
LVTRGRPVRRFMVGLSIPVTPVSQYMEGQCCCCRKAEQWQIACKFCECCEYSQTSLRHVLCWCCDLPDSPTFAKPCCADSPTFAKPCCADSPDSRKVSLASVIQIWQVWRVWQIWPFYAYKICYLFLKWPNLSCTLAPTFSKRLGEYSPDLPTFAKRCCADSPDSPTTRQRPFLRKMWLASPNLRE